MKVETVSYSEDRCAHLCVDDEGNDYYVDIMTDLGTVDDPMDLVGKVIEIDELVAYGVKVVGDGKSSREEKE